jgi:hypothetical protein
MGVSVHPVTYGKATFRSNVMYQTQEVPSECYKEEHGESSRFTCATCSLDRTYFFGICKWKCQSNEMTMTRYKTNLERIQIFHIYKYGSFSSIVINTFHILMSSPIILQSRTAFVKMARRRLCKCCSLVLEWHASRPSRCLRVGGYGFVVGMARDFCLLRLVQIDSRSHLDSCALGIWKNFSGRKVTGAWNWTLTFIRINY